MLIVENKFNIGDYVYLRTDPEQLIRLVTRIAMSINGITYETTAGTDASWHYEFEISESKGILF